MANLTPLQSSTMEGALLELALQLQVHEKYVNTNPSDYNFINVTIDTDQKRAVIAATIPINFATTGNGGYVLAIPYLKSKLSFLSLDELETWENRHIKLADNK